jgi:hypothetical protein
MESKIKTIKDFDKALEAVADEVGHEPKTLMNQYLDPDFVKKHKKEDKDDKKEGKDDKKKKSSVPLSYKTADLKMTLEDYVDDILKEEFVLPDPIRREKADTKTTPVVPVVAPPMRDRSRKREDRVKTNRRSKYMHLKQIDVRPGQTVDKGSVIGQSGETGRTSGPHLHVEFWIGKSHTTPSAYHSEFYPDKKITSRRGKRKMWGKTKTHQGMDISMKNGTPVYAMADGVVTKVIPNSSSGGNIIEITHFE